MLLKELNMRNPFTNAQVTYHNVEADDSKDFGGFIEVKFLNDGEGFKAGTIILYNKGLVSSMVPELLKDCPPANE